MRLTASKFLFRVGDGSDSGAEVLLFNSTVDEALTLQVTSEDGTVQTFEFGPADAQELAKGVRKLNSEAGRVTTRTRATSEDDSEDTEGAKEVEAPAGKRTRS